MSDQVMVLVAGTVLALAGYFGPNDAGFLEAVGLILVGLAVYSMWKGGPIR